MILSLKKQYMKIERNFIFPGSNITLKPLLPFSPRGKGLNLFGFAPSPVGQGRVRGH
jgi:hypothetical protein